MFFLIFFSNGLRKLGRNKKASILSPAHQVSSAHPQTPVEVAHQGSSRTLGLLDR